MNSRGFQPTGNVPTPIVETDPEGVVQLRPVGTQALFIKFHACFNE